MEQLEHIIGIEARGVGAAGIEQWATRESTLFRSGDGRRYSRAEKIIFRLLPECRALCKLTEELFPGIHFLDLPLSDQHTIKTLIVEREEAEIKAKRLAAELRVAKFEKPQKQHNQKETGKHARQDRQQAPNETRSKNYSELFQSLEFTPTALERLELFAAKGGISRIEKKLGLMNEGQIACRHSIARTHPTVYETKAGYDYRIYYDRSGGKIRIRLVGEKSAQEFDISRLRR